MVCAGQDMPTNCITSASVTEDNDMPYASGRKWMGLICAGTGHCGRQSSGLPVATGRWKRRRTLPAPSVAGWRAVGRAGPEEGALPGAHAGAAISEGGREAPPPSAPAAQGEGGKNNCGVHVVQLQGENRNTVGAVCASTAARGTGCLPRSTAHGAPAPALLHLPSGPWQHVVGLQGMQRAAATTDLGH